jgi:glucosylceramidase
MQTENECGDGKNSWAYAHYVFNLLHHYLSNGVNGYMYWNMVLPPGGRSTWGWAQNSLVTVDPVQKTVTYNPEFYVMKHFAQWVKRGSVRLELAGSWAGNAVAFETPEEATVVVLANPFAETVELVVEISESRSQLSLEAQSFNTLIVHH